MSRKQRVVIDTSTLVSAALRIGTIPDEALTKALDTFDLCESVEALSELEEVLSRPKFDRYRPRAARRVFFATIVRRSFLFVADMTVLNGIEPLCRDHTDNKFLALALAAGADVIVSSDHDLTVMNPWCGIPILKPAEFLTDTSITSLT